MLLCQQTLHYMFMGSCCSDNMSLPAVIASGVSHGNIMPSVCQSRLSDVHTEQSTRNGATLIRVMASGLVASYVIPVLEFTKSVHLPVTDYASASDIYCFLRQSYCFSCCMHCMANNLNLACMQLQLTGPVS